MPEDVLQATTIARRGRVAGLLSDRGKAWLAQAGGRNASEDRPPA